MAEENQQQGQQSKQQFNVKIDPENEAGKYANAVSVNVNDNEVIIDMGYILPNVKPLTIKVVDRINLNHKTAESFMKVLSNAMLDYRNKKKGSEAAEGGKDIPSEA